MIKLVTDTEYEYIPRAERGKENPTKFRLKTMTTEIALKIEDDTFEYDYEKKQTRVKPGTARLRKLQECLAGWNLPEPCTNENKGKLPMEVINELVEEINTKAALSEAEQKN